MYNCKYCRYFKQNKTNAVCKRYPTEVITTSDNYCGESKKNKSLDLEFDEKTKRCIGIKTK